MIKRPLIWILTAFLAGLYLAWQKLSVYLVFLIIILIFSAIYILMYQISNKFINKRDRFLWGMPLLLLTGFLAMSSQLKRPGLYNMFDREVPCELTGKVTMIAEKKNGFSLYVTDSTVLIDEGGPYLCENIIVNYYNDQTVSYEADASSAVYKVGNRIKVEGVLKKFTKARNPGGFDEDLYYKIMNIDFKIQAKRITVTDRGYSVYHYILNSIKKRLIQVYKSILPEKEAGTLIAMVLGEKYLLDDEIINLYQANGITHILAISGLQFSLIGLFLFGFLKKVKCPITVSTAVTILFIYSYGALTEFSVSSNRSIVMMVIFLLSPLFGKTYDFLSSMSLSALIILLQNPLQIMSVGFLLTYGAVLGIAVIYPLLKQLFPYKNSVLNGLLISAAAQSGTAPIVLNFFYQFPLYSIVVNLIILPLITLLTLTSVLAGIAGAVYMPLGVFFIGGADSILKFYERVCRIGSSLPGNLITAGKPDFIRITLCLSLLCMFIWITRRYHKKAGVILLAAALLPLLLPHRNAGLEVTFLDVGQGDAIYMESGRGTSFLVDGGSADINKVGTYRITPFLLSQGTDRLDYAIVTHTDKDHISGLKELLQAGKINIKNLILPGISNKDETYLDLEKLAGQYKIPINYITAGGIIYDGVIRITCLHPAPDYKVLSANSYSTVLSVTYGNFDILLTGDLQKDGEKPVTELLADSDYWMKYGFRPAVDYDILKVAHHGSRSSTTEEFLHVIKPELSIISCGQDNFYGHPHAELLERLDVAGVKNMITYETGAITVKTDGKRINISRYISSDYTGIK